LSDNPIEGLNHKDYFDSLVIVFGSFVEQFNLTPKK